MLGKRSLTLFVAVGACGLGGGCYNAAQVNAFLQEPRTPVSATEYRVLPPDVLLITSRNVPEIDQVTQQVRPDGKINLPLLGEIYVADKTPKQIEEALVKAAGEYYERADATVQVVGYNSQKFYVFGEVGLAGPVPWTGRDTLLDALARAQPTALAWPERIVVLRGVAPTTGGHATTQPSTTYSVTGVHPPTKDSSPKKLVFNLMAMVSSGDMSNNILLKPNDVIYVQPNPFARVALAIETMASPIRAATDGLSDYRDLMGNLRWIRDSQPWGRGAGRATIVTR